MNLGLDKRDRRDSNGLTRRGLQLISMLRSDARACLCRKALQCESGQGMRRTITALLDFLGEHKAWAGSPGLLAFPMYSGSGYLGVCEWERVLGGATSSGKRGTVP